MAKWIYGFDFLGAFNASCDVLGLYLFLRLGSIILLGDKSRFVHLGIFVKVLLLLMNFTICNKVPSMSLLNS